MDFGSLLGAGTTLLGGLLGSSSAEAQQDKMIKLQKQFAQQGIQWKVADAKKAGIHPLYALGASTHSFSPFAVGDGGLSDAISNAGQDLGRALNSSMSQNGRSVVQKTMARLTLERGALENDLLRSQIRKINQPGNAPGAPGSTVPTVLNPKQKIPGQPDVEKVPAQEIATDPLNKGVQAGRNPEIQFIVTPDDGRIPVSSELMKNATEDSWDDAAAFARKVIHGAAGWDTYAPKEPAGFGKKWVYDQDGVYRRKEINRPPSWREGPAEYGAQTRETFKRFYDLFPSLPFSGKKTYRKQGGNW